MTHLSRRRQFRALGINKNDREYIRFPPIRPNLPNVERTEARHDKYFALIEAALASQT